MKGKPINITLVILLLQTVLFSCAKEPEVEPIEETIPLKVGNEWIYQISDYDMDGNVLTTSAFRRAVEKDTIIGGSKWYLLSDGRIVQNSRDGYVYYNKINKSGKFPTVMIYQSISKGEIWYIYNYPNYDLKVVTNRTYELAPLLTSLGSFPSHRFTIENQYLQPSSHTVNTTIQKDYVAPEIGLVRSDSYFANSDKLFRRYELVSYTVR